MNRNGIQQVSRRRLRRSRRPLPAPGYRQTRRGDLVPFQPPVVVPQRPFYTPRPRRGFRRRNLNVPNTFNPRPSGYRGRSDNLVILKQEYWFSVEPGVHKYTFVIGESGVPHLDRFGAIYENAQIRHMRINYKPSAGTTIPGNLTMGIDYSPKNERKAEDIKTLDTNASGTIFSPSSLRVIVNRAQKNVSWLPTAAAGDEKHAFFALYIDAQTKAEDVGQIWISYKIAFSDPTSPSGTAVNKQSITTVTSTLTSDIMVDQASMLDVGTNTENIVEVVEPTRPTEITDEGTNYETKIQIAEDTAVGTEITIGSSHSIPASSAAYAYRASPPKITFKYTDGTPVPDGTIVPLQHSGPLVFRSPGMQSDIFASIFKFLKPLAKPVWGFLDQLVQPIISYGPVPGTDAELTYDPSLYPTDQLTSFAFVGDTATINVPSTDRDSVTSRYPVTIAQSLGHGQGPDVEGYVSVWSHNLYSHPTSWLASVDDGGGTGYSTILKTVFRHPDEESASFQNGDLVSIFFNTIPIEQGIGVDVRTPFTAPLDDTAIRRIITALETSTLSQTEEIDPKAPKLKVLDYTNKTSETGRGATVGAWMTARFVSTFSESKYKFAVLAFPVGHLASGVDINGTVVDHAYFHTPDPKYNVAIGLMTFQFFPTVSQTLKVHKTDHSFSIARVEDENEKVTRVAVMQRNNDIRELHSLINKLEDVTFSSDSEEE